MTERCRSPRGAVILVVSGALLATTAILVPTRLLRAQGNLPPAPVTPQTAPVPEPGGGTGQVVRFIRVNGYGVVRARPSEAHISFLVSSTGVNPVNTLQDNDKQVAKVVTELHEHGVAAGNITWSPSSLGAPSAVPAPTSSTIDLPDSGAAPAQYTANARVDVKTFDITHVTTIVELGMDAKATSVLGMSFQPQDVDKLKRQALVLALEDAANKAGVLSEGISPKGGAPVRVLYVISVTEAPATTPEPPAITTAPPAEVAISMNIDVVYAIG